MLQAEIASLHAAGETDWRQIASMYGELLRVTGSPVVELNRAVAIGEAEGPSAGLAAIEGLQLDGYLYFHTTRADFLRRLDRRDEARESYLKALGARPLRRRAAVPRAAAGRNRAPEA